MSIDELKTEWESIDDATIHDSISKEEIELALTSKYRSFATKAIVFEGLLLLVYLYFTVLTIFRFDELKELYLQGLGVAAIIILLLLFIVKGKSLKESLLIRFTDLPHTQAIKSLSIRMVNENRNFVLKIVLAFLLTILLFVLNIKIYGEYDLVKSSTFWAITISACLLLTILINRRVRNSYTMVVRESEELLRELT